MTVELKMCTYLQTIDMQRALNVKKLLPSILELPCSSLSVTPKMPYTLITVTFEPRLHALSQEVFVDTHTHMTAVVEWYRQRLQNYEYCVFSHPALTRHARRRMSVKRMPHGRIAVVFPVPGDAPMDDVSVESACIADPDDDGNYPLALTVMRCKKATTVSVLVGSRRETICNPVCATVAVGDSTL